MADSNPANFANLPKDQLKEIAAKGGHASHGGSSESEVGVYHVTTSIAARHILT